MRNETIRLIKNSGRLIKHIDIKEAFYLMEACLADPIDPLKPQRGLVYRPIKLSTTTAQVGALAPTKKTMPCEICGFSRSIERAHIVPARFGGQLIPENVLFLCPNHHTLFDRHLLTDDEMRSIWPKVNKAIKTVLTDDRCSSWQKQIVKKYSFLAIAG